MALFINSFEGGSRVVTPGERRFGARLRDLLEEDYLCWFNVPIGERRQYPDFILLHPGRGLWIFEVKDWRLDFVHSIDKISVELIVEDGLKTVANPLEQARQYCMAVVNRLSSDPQLQDPSDRYRGKLAFPYGYACVLTNITRRQLNEVMEPEQQDDVLPSRLVICKDEMTESVTSDIFQEKLWGMFQYRFGNRLSLPQIERVRWHLFPEIRIAAVQQELFASHSPICDAAKEKAIPEIVRVMDIAQEQLARSLGNGHRVIHGVAGSGKTLILGFRCVHLAHSVSKPVLVLCFNITLAARLRAFVEDRQIADKVQVYHFHEWCKAQLVAYHVDLVASEKPTWERQVESVIEGVERGLIPRAQYGAVMIDEGHDFEPEWLKLVVQMIDPEQDSLLLLYDDAQAIYRKSNALNFSLSSVGIKAQGRTTILRLNYRNTREIMAFAYEFVAGFLDAINKCDDHFPILRPDSAGPSGPFPEVCRRSSLTAEVQYVAQRIAAWHSAGVPLNDMAVIYFHTHHGRLVAQELESNGVDHLLAADSVGKKAYDPRKAQVTILSAASSKGLEFAFVIVIGIGHLPNEEDQAATARLLYVSITRAKERLLLMASRSNKFVERLSVLGVRRKATLAKGE